MNLKFFCGWYVWYLVDWLDEGLGGKLVDVGVPTTPPMPLKPTAYSVPSLLLRNNTLDHAPIAPRNRSERRAEPKSVHRTKYKNFVVSGLPLWCARDLI